MIETRERELSPWWWLGLPLLMLAAYVVAVAVMSDEGVRWLRSEHGPVEWGQAACFAAAGGVACVLAVRARFAPRWVRMGYLAFGLLALLVTGEELSWGQHLLGFETPDALAALNKQGEANLHNLWDDLPSRIMRRLLEITLPLLCIVLPLGLKIAGIGWRRGDWSWYTLPRLEMVPTLLIAALGRPLKDSQHWGWPARWHEDTSEFAELFWAFGILLWIWVLARRVGDGRSTSPSEPESPPPQSGASPSGEAARDRL